MEMHEQVVREFLHDHPEHIQGVRYVPGVLISDRPLELVLDTDAMIALTDWTIKTGLGNAEKAKAFREFLRKKFGK